MELELESKLTCPFRSSPGGTAPAAEGEFPRSRLVIDRVVGTGAFGVVCRGYAFDLPGLTGWKTVAIKTVPGGVHPMNLICIERFTRSINNARGII